MTDIYIYRVPLPHDIHEAVTPDEDDDGYTIYIDETADADQARRSYAHALDHIRCCDFENCDADQIEKNRH